MTNPSTSKTRLNRFKKLTGISNPDPAVVNKIYEDPAGCYRDIQMFLDLAVLGKIKVPDELRADLEEYKQHNSPQSCLARVLKEM